MRKLLVCITSVLCRLAVYLEIFLGRLRAKSGGWVGVGILKAEALGMTVKFSVTRFRNSEVTSAFVKCPSNTLSMPATALYT